ncbi:unnamed protein product [Clonostachys rosea]|uniref:Uncharacterized protein n=1 Tax=Bionectria ochroleuca TaxID=29856 RepID=A0ABY6U8N1_BIOOC|nr:unnamed protein product [Clonostachys rosea]
MAGSDHEDGPAGHKLKKQGTFSMAASRLSLFNNPLKTHDEEDDEHLIGSDGEHHHQHHHSSSSVESANLKPVDDDEESPLQFAKREAASTSELFYDLWFVANLTVFATVHPITTLGTLVSFVGFFLLLWNTWFITTVFDARFGQDGILPRICRACHLAVMVGFAVVGVAFDSKSLIRPIIKGTSLFLALSRLVLALQYSLILFHARHHRRSRKPLIVAVILHILPFIAYLIAGIVSNQKEDQQLLYVWYGIGLMELLSIIVHATVSKTLSFEGTHFNERLNLLTLIIIGEGVIILLKNVTKIVEYTYLKGISTSWSPALIGILICSAAILYITFQLYFDWMHHHNHIAPIRQAFWTIIHLPFHASLVLLAEGGGQWGIWWRATESYNEAGNKLLKVVKDILEDTPVKSADVADGLHDAAFDIMKKYGADVEEGSKDIQGMEEVFKNISSLSDSLWVKGDESEDYQTWIDGVLSITTSVFNSISKAFGLVIQKKEKQTATSVNWQDAEMAAIQQTQERQELVFTYLFVSAGIVLIFLMIMHLLSKQKGWSIFNMFRVGLVLLMGIGLGLVPVLHTNPTHLTTFLLTPWQLPAVTIVYFIVLILTHLPHPPRIYIKRSEIQDIEMSQKPGMEPSRAPNQAPNHQAQGMAPTTAYDPNASYAAGGYSDHPGPQAAPYDPTATSQAATAGYPGYYPGQHDDTTYYGGSAVQMPPMPPPVPASGPVPKRGMTLRRGLTIMQQAAKSIHIERAPYSPINDDQYDPNRRIGGLYHQG